MAASHRQQMEDLITELQDLKEKCQSQAQVLRRQRIELSEMSEELADLKAEQAKSLEKEAAEAAIEGDTPLSIAAHSGDVVKVRKLLLEKPNLESRNKCDETPLLKAAGTVANFGVLKALIAVGADVTVQDDKGNSVLHNIACSGDVGMFDYLCQRPGIELEARNKNAQTPRDLAREFNQDAIVLYIDNKKLLQSCREALAAQEKAVAELRAENKKLAEQLQKQLNSSATQASSAVLPAGKSTGAAQGGLFAALANNPATTSSFSAQNELPEEELPQVEFV